MTSPSVTLRQFVSEATPGPWEHRVWGRAEDEWPDRRVSVGTTTGHGAAVCISPRYGSLDQSENDARLIALTPALAVGLADAIDALEAAEKEASIAHDAIWSKEVAHGAILHDNQREDSATAAIWRLHEAIRPVLARLGDLVGQEPTA